MDIDRVIVTPMKPDEGVSNESNGVRPFSALGNDFDSHRQWGNSFAAVDAALADLERAIRKRLRRNRLRRLFRFWWPGR